MAKIDYGELCECHEAACLGRPLPYDHRPWVDWSDTEHASDNKYLIANATQVALGEDLDECARFAEHLASRPLHEDETLTGSGSYRKTIDGSTLDLAAALRHVGRPAAAELLLRRTRASIANLLLGIGNGLPRAVVDHGVPGKPLVLIGDGPRAPLAGDPQGRTPHVAIAGMRSHVRARRDETAGGSHFSGPFEYTEAQEQRVMLAQLLGHPYLERRYGYEHVVYAWARERGVAAWGFAAEEIELARAFVRDPLDVELAQRLAAIAGECLPGLRVHYDRYADGAVFVWISELPASSTGGRPISGQYADGRIVHASADHGGRARGDVKRQRAWEDAGAYYCQHAEGGPALRIPKPSAPLAYRVVIDPRTGVEVLIGGRPAAVAPPLPGPQPPAPAPPLPPLPAPIELSVGARPLSELGRQQVAAALGRPIAPGSYLVTVNLEDVEVLPIWGAPGEPVRLVVTRRAS